MACLDESTALAFASGRMAPAARALAVAHLATCDACRRLVVLGRAPARPAATAGLDTSATMPLDAAFTPAPREASGDAATATVESELPRGTIVGRYTILDLVGRGGAGEVYAAYDPKLDRRVALKLLRPERIGPGDAGEARLFREAQAIAKISHPNVVTVHDVGTHGDRVFLAMEFVDGATVKDWLAAAPRARREILEVFKGAARGLAAAHAAGLVHRDFKPQNVMVTKDGAARVMDFGLVRQVGPEGAASASGDDFRMGDAGQGAGDVELTRTGDLVGTPRYMGPEQFKAEPADARTDQFAFCVSLYEALYGQRPFEGDALPTLIANVLAGNVAPPPAKTGVPGWIRRVVLRGLATDPAQRFPSMHALVAALEDDPTVRHRRLALIAGIAACTLLAAAAARRFAGPGRVDCGGGLDRWAQTWTPATAGAASGRRDAIHGAFAATGRSYAEQAFGGAAASLDAYVRTSVGLYEDACVAHARGEQSSEVLDLRMSCLQERLASARALTDLFSRADGEVVENALAATSGLPTLDRCSNVPLLRAIVKPPENEELRRRVDALRGEVERLAALRDGGHCVEAERLAESLIARVRATGYSPLLADALTAAGNLGNQCADGKVSLARFEEAYTAAVAAHDDEAAALAALEAAGTSSNREGQVAVGRTWIGIAHATLQRAPGHPLLEAWYQGALGTQLMTEGRGAEAVDAFRASQAARKTLLGAESLDAVMVSNNVGIALTSAGRPGEAVVELGHAEALARRVLGVEHPMLALLYGNEGEALNALRDHAKAWDAFERALVIWRVAGADPAYIAYGLTGQGLALLGQGKPREAVAPLETSLRLATDKHDSPTHVDETRALLARALWARPSDRPRARALAEKARADYDATGAKDKAAAVAAWLAAPTASL